MTATVHSGIVRRGITCAALACLLAACATQQPATSAKLDGKLQTILEPTLAASAMAAEAQYDYEAAAKYYRNLLGRKPGDLELSVRLARSLRYAGKVDNAIQVLMPLVAGGDPAVPVLVELGKAHLAADHLSLAVRYLDQARAKAPQDWEVLSAVGVVYDYQNRFGDAQQAYLEALAAAPNNPVVLNNLALSQAQSGDLAGAIDTLRKALEQPGSTAQIRQNLALMLALSGDLQGAERLARVDLPKDMVRDNMSYYRRLTAGP